MESQEPDKPSRYKALMDGILSFSTWNHTAQPCKELVATFLAANQAWDNGDASFATSGGMGVLDVQTLEGCVHWRSVGRMLVADLSNSSTTGRMHSEADCCSHMLLSIEDFASVIARHKGLGTRVLESLPHVLGSLVRNNTIYTHVMKVWDSAKQSAILMYLDSVWSHVSGSKSNSSSSFMSANSSQVIAMKKFMREHQRHVALFHAFANSPSVFGVGEYYDAHSDAVTEPSNCTNDTNVSKSSSRSHTRSHIGIGNISLHSHTHGRRLMQEQQEQQQQGVRENRSPVDMYSSMVASTSGYSNLKVRNFATSSIPLVTSSWLEGPLGWPPKFSTVQFGNGTCPAGESALETMNEIFRVVRVYYEVDYSTKVSKPPWDLSKNLPKVYVPQPLETNSSGAAGGLGEASTAESMVVGSGSFWDFVSAATSDQGNWAPLLYGSAIGTVHDYAPWAEESAAGFFTVRRDRKVPKDALTLGNLAHDMFVCEFDNVMFCGREGEDGLRIRRNIFLCMVVALVTWIVLAVVLGVIPVFGGLCSMLVYAWLPLLVAVTGTHLAYGMAVTCFPMVPTCVLQVRLGFPNTHVA